MELTFKITDTYSIQPGADHFECIYTNVTTDHEMAVQGAYGVQSPGGHHITVYYTTNKQTPTHHECVDAEMVEWHMVGGTAGDSAEITDQLKLPDGLGIRIPAGVQIVLQVHYINATDEVITPKGDWVRLNLIDPTTLDAFVNQFVVVDEDFKIPAGQAFQKVTTCTVPQDVQVVRLLGHMHEWGKHYTLEKVDANGNRLDMLYEKDWEPSFTSNPPVVQYPKDQPLLLTAGTRLRQTCQWSNNENYDLIFPREMCVGFTFYYPDVGDLLCDNH